MSRSNWSEVSRHQRGYGTAWNKLRLTILDRDSYLCQCHHCKAENRTKLATHVDHVRPKSECQKLGWTQAQMDDPSNLQSINSECHKRKTVEDEGRTMKLRIHIGIDGYPVKS